MATLAPNSSGVAARGSEERFFFKLACTMAAVLVAGFSLNLAMGRSSFAVPLIYHLHAGIFFGWTALFVTQVGLASSNNLGYEQGGQPKKMPACKW